MVKSMKIKLNTIQWTLSCFIILWLNGGNFEYIQRFFPQAVKFGLVALWFIVTICVYKKFLSLYLAKVAPILFMIFIIFLSDLVGNTRYYGLYFMNYLYYAIIFAVFVCGFYFYSRQENKLLLIILITDISIVTIHTMIELIRNPVLVRAMSTGADAKMSLLNGAVPIGVGGYGMCYQLVFCAMLLMILLNKNPLNTVWICLLEVVIFWVLFSAQITLALLMQAGGIIAMLLFRSDSKNFLWKILFFVVLLLIMFNLESILQLLISYASEDLAVRLEELLGIGDITTTSSGDIASRYRLYWSSFSLFLQNPLWGSFGGNGIGCHSTFLDLLGAYGLLGVAGILGVMRPVLLTLKKCAIKSARINLMIIYGVLFILSLVNVSIGSDILLVTAFLVPLCFKVRYSQEKIE